MTTVDGQLRMSICQLCLPNTTFLEDLELARRHGYTGISLDVNKMPAGRDAELLDAYVASGLRAAACCASVWSILPTPNFPEPARPADRLALIADGIGRLAPFRPDTIFCATGVPGGAACQPDDDDWATVHKGLRELAAIARDHGTRLSLEPMTRQGGEIIRYPMVGSLEAAVALFDGLGLPDAQVIVDVWHLYDSPGLLDQLRRHVDRIAAVQACDYRAPRTWRDRAMPGAGVGDVPGIFGELDAAGFTGWLDLEVFSDELWKLPDDEFFRLGAQSIMDTWAAREARR